MANAGVGVVAAPFVESYCRFWADPIGQAPILNEQSRAAGTNAAETFQCHGATAAFLYTVRPQELLRLVPATPPIPLTFFDENGDIDLALLTPAWEEYQASLPPPPEIPVIPLP